MSETTQVYYDPCPECDGRAGKLESDWEGDGEWAMAVDRLDLCGCASSGQCPGCLLQVQADAIDVDTFVCERCGWAYDAERFYPSEPDYYPGDWED